MHKLFYDYSILFNIIIKNFTKRDLKNRILISEKNKLHKEEGMATQQEILMLEIKR